jgi:hypothetical protein
MPNIPSESAPLCSHSDQGPEKRRYEYRRHLTQIPTKGLPDSVRTRSVSQFLVRVPNSTGFPSHDPGGGPTAVDDAQPAHTTAAKAHNQKARILL